MKRKYTGLKKATAVPTMPPAQTPNPIAKLSKIKAEKSIDIFEFWLYIYCVFLYTFTF